ncbi:MAG: OmpA family protein [Saprospiraceae bacterium]|jgi:NitT/TauT family transport system substrate-binding protein|nr:OmpA family protein [Saprospiraceae bacterium]MBL0293467.1 OmpA family protein [Saprospiraceae bacterium]
MGSRLTPLSRILIVIGIVAGAYFGGRYLLNNTSFGEKIKSQSTSSSSANDDEGSSSDDKDVIKVGVVTWPGYAGGQYFNEGFKANTNSRYFKDYGFKVEFKVLDDFEASRAAWKKGDVDLLWCTIDALPTEMAALADFEPKVVFQADWSRGGDAVVARRGIQKVADLRGKKIAVAEMTPSHSFLLWLLEAGGLSVKDVQIVPQPNAIDAASVFKSQQVDAAVVWSPDDADCVKSVPGARILESTKSASNIIADAFIAKKSFVDSHETKLQQLYEGWMQGAAEINSSDVNKRKAAKILSQAFDGFTEADMYSALGNVRLATHGDNKNFFGLNPSYKGVKAEELYTRMADVYKGLGFAQGKVPSWRLASNPIAISSTDLAGVSHQAEGQKSFATISQNEAADKEAVATKRVSITFRSGEFALDENAKYIVDKEMVSIAKAFSNARIRIEGNTDNVGNRESNLSLSQKRAQSVANYLIGTYGMPRNRFIVIGNGPDNPVADNATDAGRNKNRRTDFELISE